VAGSSQAQQQQQLPRKRKQRLVEVQRGPVRVAVLPALSGPAAAGGSAQQQQQQSAGAILRQQLLESRLHRSKAML
jgi:hypothetical protein